ncbi:MAG: nuclear transport factor 2 family protein [Actinomycetota bacterium]|nr:nuclear transport factor 2 family protein [Actinomycetota bacterium]
MDSAEAELLALHDRFCQGFAERRPELVLETVANTPELAVVTSEEALMRGVDELRNFLERYAAGTTTYSWTWARRDTAIFQAGGCILAVGTERASSAGGEESTPYRMTLVAERQTERWAIVQVHGSSPHPA